MTRSDAPLELVPPTIVGTWRLVSLVGRRDDGSIVEPFGADPRGSLIYTASRLISVHVHRDRRSGLRDYAAFYGSYTWSPDDGKVIHHIEGSLQPSQKGADQTWLATLEGDRLELIAPRPSWAGEVVTATLVWERSPSWR